MLLIFHAQHLLLFIPKLSERNSKAGELVIGHAFCTEAINPQCLDKVLGIRQCLLRGRLIQHIFKAKHFGKLVIRSLREYFPYPFHNTQSGGFGILPVVSCHIVISPQMLRQAVNGNAPAVFIPVFVFPPSKIPHAQIGLHLKLCNFAFKVLFPIFAETGLLFYFKRVMLPIGEILSKQVHDLFGTDRGKFIIPSRIKVIPIPPVICKDREPFP